MAVDLVEELVARQIDPREKFNRHNFCHVLVVTIAAIPLTCILIIIFVVAIVRLKSAGALLFYKLT